MYIVDSLLQCIIIFQIHTTLSTLDEKSILETVVMVRRDATSLCSSAERSVSEGCSPQDKVIGSCVQ